MREAVRGLSGRCAPNRSQAWVGVWSGRRPLRERSRCRCLPLLPVLRLRPTCCSGRGQLTWARAQLLRWTRLWPSPQGRQHVRRAERVRMRRSRAAQRPPAIRQQTHKRFATRNMDMDVRVHAQT